MLDTGFGEAFGRMAGREVGEPDNESSRLANGRIRDEGLSDIAEEPEKTVVWESATQHGLKLYQHLKT